MSRWTPWTQRTSARMLCWTDLTTLASRLAEVVRHMGISARVGLLCTGSLSETTSSRLPCSWRLSRDAEWQRSVSGCCAVSSDFSSSGLASSGRDLRPVTSSQQYVYVRPQTYGG